MLSGEPSRCTYTHSPRSKRYARARRGSAEAACAEKAGSAEDLNRTALGAGRHRFNWGSRAQLAPSTVRPELKPASVAVRQVNPATTTHCSLSRLNRSLPDG